MWLKASGCDALGRISTEYGRILSRCPWPEGRSLGDPRWIQCWRWSCLSSRNKHIEKTVVEDQGETWDSYSFELFLSLTGAIPKIQKLKLSRNADVAPIYARKKFYARTVTTNTVYPVRGNCACTHFPRPPTTLDTLIHMFPPSQRSYSEQSLTVIVKHLFTDTPSQMELLSSSLLCAKETT